MNKVYNIIHKISHEKSNWFDVFITIGILMACSLIGLLFFFLGLSEANIITIYVLGILLISSVVSDRMYGIISSIVGVLLFNCLFAEPRFTLFVYDLQYSVTTIIMLIASIITSYVMTLLRFQLNREILEARRLDILLETSQNLQQAQDIDDIFHVVVKQLYCLFERTVLIFPVLEGKLLSPIIKSVDDNSNFAPCDWGLDETALEQFFYLESEIKAKNPLIRIRNKQKAIFFKIGVKNTIFAVMGIILDANKDITGFERNLILAILDEATTSLEKHHLHMFNERIAREAEAERLRTSLLRTISHDLRTPLTSISGNADILLNNGEKIEFDVRMQLYQNIYDDSEWLISLVENLLFVTRIENGVMPIRTEPEILQEVIPEAFNCIARRAKDHNVSLELPEELLIVKIDSRLFMQVIINIVDNAIKYTPPGSDIKIRAFRRGLQAVVEVADTGYGISDKDKKNIFQMFYTINNKSGDSRRGIGLGLPLCQSIMHAHGGTIHIEDNTPKGNIVVLGLNSEEVYLADEHIGN